MRVRWQRDASGGNAPHDNVITLPTPRDRGPDDDKDACVAAFA
jgi:hypothetical protein